MKQCPQCGTVNADAAQVCASCGVGLQQVPPQQPAQPTQQQPAQPVQPTQQIPVVGAQQVAPAASGGVHWIVWVLAAALGVAVIGLVVLGVLLFSYSGSDEPAAEPVATATAEATSQAQPATATPQQPVATPPQTAPQQPAPQAPAQSGVDITYESGTSPTFITDVFTVNGQNYVTVDWIQVLDNPDWGWEVKNENPKLRTFLLPASAYLAEKDPGTAQEYGISYSELKAASDRGDYAPANSRIFDITVSNGEVQSIVEWWHP
jgi:flagellar basal body-associated protein FliL